MVFTTASIDTLHLFEPAYLSKTSDATQIRVFSDRKSHCVVELMPNGTASKRYQNLKHRLSEYKLLLVALQLALRDYCSGKLSSFDSLVGENSCQIRATIMCALNQYAPSSVTLLLEQTSKLIEKINKEIAFCEQSNLDQEMSLSEFLLKNELHQMLTPKELFLVISLILNQVRVLLPPEPSKQITRNESTVTSRVKEFGSVGSTFSRELVKHLRKILSAISVNFVQDIATMLLLPDSISQMVTDKYCIDYNKFGHLKCLPCFWYTLMLIKYSLQKELPLVLSVKQMATDKNYAVVREFSLVFKVENKQFVETSFEDLSKDTPVITILGSSCRKANAFFDLEQSKAEILEKGPVDLVLAYSAVHRQYPDESKDALVKSANNNLIKYYSTKAEEWGCSLENPSLFFLGHVYTDKLGNVVEQIGIKSPEVELSLTV